VSGTERPIRFWHQGGLKELDTDTPTRSVLNWLREDAHCTGTKEGCAEGDCGACTVVVGSLDANGALQLQPMNSCLQFLPTLDGKALFTVEDVGGHGEPLHPVQQALVDCHGSQCGFCTPGFVMTLWHQWETRGATPPDRQQLADALAGNLCRCTGYRPILDAGECALRQEGPLLDRAPVEAALQALGQDPPLAHAGFHAPRTLDECAALVAAKPQATLLGGATDIGLWVNKQFRDLGEVIDLGRVDELKAIERTPTHLRIGAGASLEAAWGALAAQWPALKELWLRFASPPVRFAGTMGGNVANGSPIGDSAPVLMALGARVELRHGAAVRQLPLDAFYTGYMKNERRPGELLTAIEVPWNEGWTLRAFKVSKRFDSDISALCGAFALRLEHGVVTDLRLAWGGMAATVARSAQAEAALRGQPWDEAHLQAAQAALAQDFRPMSDLRASADYRLQVAQNLLRRLWLETRADAPLAPEALSVWAAR
jgi:xanthine dehydrogenase small subunit